MAAKNWLVAVVAACCGAALLASIQWTRAQHPERATEKVVLGPVAGATYIGSEACGRCHQEAWTAWQKSGHSRVILDAVEHPGAILGDFAQLADYSSEQPTPAFGPEDVALVHGNMWKQAYVNRDWKVWPAQWNLVTEQWQPLKPKDWESRDWRKLCAACHVTGFDPGSLQWNELGVGCESCHGPGSRHAEAPDAEKKSTIVNPSMLTPDMSADICGWCHTRGKTPDGEFDFPVGFVPGGRLLPQHFTPLSKPGGKAMWPDGSPKQHRQMFSAWKQSKHRAAGVTCSTCHAAHGAGLKNGMRKAPNQLCRDCHADISTDPLTGHAPIAGAPQHSNCIGCHMAPTATIAIQGDERVHTSRVIHPKVTVQLGDGDPAKQPNSCNHCHAHQDDSPVRLQQALDDGLSMKHVNAESGPLFRDSRARPHDR